MKTKVWIKRLASLWGLGVFALVLVILLRTTSLGEGVTWQRQASPGRLSAAHGFLENNCAACHTAVIGPDPTKCIACHATNESILQRQPSAFHADIGICRECHLEHRGVARRPTDMDHAALAKIGLRQLQGSEQSAGDGDSLRKQLLTWIDRNGAAGRVPLLHPGITAYEAVLNCATCHANQDRHFKFFGQDCAQCHSTSKWTIPEFRHPSPRSRDCAQCHQAPPCHYMTNHFNKVCAVVAGQPHARVNQCYLCHQTTAWNDIKGFGWCKCH